MTKIFLHLSSFLLDNFIVSQKISTFALLMATCTYIYICIYTNIRI